MTFKELFQTGQCSISAIDAWSEIWHGRAGMAQSLQAFLGLSDEEYHVWLVEGNAGLAQTLNRGHMPAYETVYLSWDELTAQLQEIVDAELGPGFTVDLRRQDFYYWDMRLETAHKMNEALSEKICACLDLRDVDVLVFLEDDWVDNNCLCGLLSKLTHREVTSSHADDHGVWIICKSLVWSSPEFTAYLLRACLKSSNKDGNEGKSKNLSRNKEFAFTIFPKSAEFVKPAKKTLYHPTARQHNKFVQFVTLYYFDLSTANLLDLIGKALTRVPSIHQKLLYTGKIVQVEKDHLNSSIPVCNISGCHGYGMRQPHRIYDNVAFDSRYFFPASYPFSSAVSAFCTLCASTIPKVVLSRLRSSFRIRLTSLCKTLSRTLTPVSSFSDHTRK